jgi:5-methylcytosine-specific restriction endonuclease McrA
MEKRICTKCNIEKDIKEYNLQKSNSGGVSYWCRDCCSKYKKQYRKNNKEAIREYYKKYREENKESIKENKKQYVEDNKEVIKEYHKRYTEDNKEVMKKYKKKYVEEHRDIYSIYTQKRNAILKQLPSTLTLEQWDNVKQHFNNSCAYCGKEKPLAQEHFIPLSKGGEYSHNNIIPSCQSCNSSKSNKVFEEWYSKQKYYSNKREQKIYKFLNYDKGEQQLMMSI